MTDEKYTKRAVTKDMKELVARLEVAGIDASADRWSAGIEHHPKAEELARQIGDIDFVFFGDYFGFKFGGDGDNGETLIYMLDVLFELADKSATVRQVRPTDEIKAKLAELKSDERIGYPSAKVEVNAPLALLQVYLETYVEALEWVLQTSKDVQS